MHSPPRFARAAYGRRRIAAWSLPAHGARACRVRSRSNAGNVDEPIDEIVRERRTNEGPRAGLAFLEDDRDSSKERLRAHAFTPGAWMQVDPAPLWKQVEAHGGFDLEDRSRGRDVDNAVRESRER